MKIDHYLGSAEEIELLEIEGETYGMRVFLMNYTVDMLGATEANNVLYGTDEANIGNGWRVMIDSMAMEVTIY
ncbi:MAG: hypothetical protein P8144_09680 [Gammaproteobacteria bacterium]